MSVAYLVWTMNTSPVLQSTLEHVVLHIAPTRATSAPVPLTAWGRAVFPIASTGNSQQCTLQTTWCNPTSLLERRFKLLYILRHFLCSYHFKQTACYVSKRNNSPAPVYIMTFKAHLWVWLCSTATIVPTAPVIKMNRRKQGISHFHRGFRPVPCKPTLNTGWPRSQVSNKERLVAPVKSQEGHLCIQKAIISTVLPVLGCYQGILQRCHTLYWLHKLNKTYMLTGHGKHGSF